MTVHFPIISYNHLLIVVLLYYSCHVRSSEVTSNRFRCVETERDALLHFKRGILVDYCGLLDSWGRSNDCCQWRGIRCNNQSGHIISLKLCGYRVPNNYHGYKPCLEGTLGVSLLKLRHLKYLDLSGNNFDGQLPKFIGSLTSLEHLNLSNAGFRGVIPQEIGNLSRLTSLDLRGKLKMMVDKSVMRVENLGWLSRMRSLREVDLSRVDLSATKNTWLSIVNNLPFLRELRLDTCKLSLKSPPSLSYINSSTTLSVVSLSGNYLNNTSIFDWLFNLSGLETSLVYLDLSFNKMFGNDLKLSKSSLKLLDNFCRLETLDMTFTNINYKFYDIVQSFSTCPHKALASLKLSGNQVWGSIPDNIDTFSNLKTLEIYQNQLNGIIPQSLCRLTMLESLHLAFNSLNGTLTTAHLSNLSKLRYMELSYNTELVVNISTDWIPPFQLDTLRLRSCKIGPNFPRWITTQNNLSEIDISHTNISDTIPIFFWNSSLLSGISYLDMSHNMIYGIIPNVSIVFKNLPEIELSYNFFEGVVPSFLRNNVLILHLHNNKFSKGISHFLCPHTQVPLYDLDLSSNLFSGKIPDCWSYFDQLEDLHLENNSLWGNLPTSMGALDQLRGVHLSKNNLSGELPTSLLNCKLLVILDLADNSLVGQIPHNFGHSFKYLTILDLQNNGFTGVIPTSFCDLSHLRLMDLSNNHISGTIPRCLYKLVSMANTVDESSSQLLVYFLGGYDNYGVTRVMWKRNEQAFGGSSSLALLKGIDISNNELQGCIPEGISSLIGLKFLNLSRNNLSGAVMSRIGQMTSLESLDLSHNHLTGEIPASLANISSLTTFDISDNNLTGKIPVGTQLQSFDASSYVGNSGLCGAPLPQCDKDEEAPAVAPNENGKQDTKNEFMVGMYISVVLGYVTGFWGVCGTLALKRSWRHAFFRFYEDTKDRVYVFWVVNIAKAWMKN